MVKGLPEVGMWGPTELMATYQVELHQQMGQNAACSRKKNLGAAVEKSKNGIVNIVRGDTHFDLVGGNCNTPTVVMRSTKEERGFRFSSAKLRRCSKSKGHVSKKKHDTQMLIHLMSLSW